MKKLLLFCALTVAYSGVDAQNFGSLDAIIQKLEKRNKNNKNAVDYSIQNKKFVNLQSFDDHDERHIIEFNNDNSITLIELFDDKSTGQSSSNIFSGDFVRKNNIISIRADKLEGQKIAIPVTHMFYLMNVKDIWYLKDMNNNLRWIENNSLGKKK
ncbi:hypothetical protein [Chryseobacterium sp. T1]